MTHAIDDRVSHTDFSYWLYRAWGRIGTNIGGNKVDRCGSQAMAISRFQELYSEKTGNYWDDREHFEKIANKFYPLEVDYGQVCHENRAGCVRVSDI